MARILEFCDGAERGDMTWWTSTNGSINTPNAIHGTYCYIIPGGSTYYGYKTLPSTLSEFYFRFWGKFSLPTNRVLFRSGSTNLLVLTVSILNRFDITGGATGSTANNTVNIGSWQCYEVYYKISNTVGVVTIRIDGVEVFTFSGDTQPGADTTIDNIYFDSPFAGMYLDDFALDDADWCGLSYYVGLTVDADGTLNEWTPSAGSNYQNVEIPANDSTYNSTNLAKTDEYNLTTTDITGKTVLRVIPFGRVQNPSGGSVNLGVLTHALPYTAVVATPTSFAWKNGDEYELNPNTGNPWNQAEIDALQIHIDTL